MSGVDDVEDVRRYQKPYSGRRTIPTISKYREEKAARQEEALKSEVEEHDKLPHDPGGETAGSGDDQVHESKDGDSHENTQDGEESTMQDTSQVDPSSTDARQRRKNMKQRKRERAEREVTDPVTHLPVVIHDFTDEALNQVDFTNGSLTADGPDMKSETPSSKTDSNENLNNKEATKSQTQYETNNTNFPPPDFDILGRNLNAINNRGLTIGVTSCCVLSLAALWLGAFSRDTSTVAWLVLSLLAGGGIVLVVYGVRSYTTHKITSIFQDEIWDAHRRQLSAETKRHETESTRWLNSLLGAVWPLINPDLFVSLSDTLEDVMQASLPGLVKMVSVEDIGQGSEAMRVLGIQWLPTGAATKSVGTDGKLTSEDKHAAVAEGMEAEEGDFVNMEVAFAYRTRSSSRSLKDRTNDMHLYVAFFLPGNIKIPVWVNLQGIIGTVRLRLQLCPDPPFFSLCTLTLMGQPKVDVGCVPLSRHGLNIMDVPLISNFVQSAIDAAVAQYVAPKSLTLDLKDMLAGDDFKKDTVSRGVLVVHIKRGYDFKEGDAGIPLLRDASSDPYVSVGWAKFGKVLWSTRIMKSEMEPSWDETCFVLVTAEELNSAERLRLQLWDSDRFTADDDLGRIEVDLKELMQSENSRGKMVDRADGFRALKAGSTMPGKLEWSVGYFPKTRIQQSQFEQQTHDPKTRSMEQLKEKVNKSCEKKLREAMIKEGRNARDDGELEQQTLQEMKTEQDAMIISAPPPDGYPSGILSIQIHNITGLELERLSKPQAQDYEEESDEEEEGDGLPSSYCTIIVNHGKTFKTRTKPQNSKPFFNAGCERFIRDWRECEIYISVRDARLHEDNPLLGIVHLPLAEVFKDRSQYMAFYPLAGGVGHGRIRVSMVWRSVQLQAPSSLLGWQYGTVGVQPTAVSTECPEELRSCKLKLKTDISMGKMYASDESQEGKWTAKKDQTLHLAVKKRYGTCLAIEFRSYKRFLGSNVSAFAILWLQELVDDEEKEVELPIWKGDYDRAISNCLEDCGEKLGTIKLTLTFWPGLVSTGLSKVLMSGTN